MNRIDQKFQQLKANGQTGLVTYLMAGDPDGETAQKLMIAAADAGADLLEIGMPFSDPMADGPAIQEAALRALAGGADMHATLNTVRAVHAAKPDHPIILMGYTNPILQYGVEGFCADAANAGVDGLIIVDLPPEEADMIAAHAAANAIHLIYLITPTTDDARLQVILNRASGFLYYVSVAGITGTSSAAASDIQQRVDWIQSRTDIPLVVGFGIKTPQDAADMARSGCAAIVVGSALIAHIADAQAPLQACTMMTKALKEAL